MSPHEHEPQSAPRPATDPEPPLSPRAAFFDLDGTLIIGQTQRLLVSFLFSREKVGLGFLLGTMAWFAGYKAGIFRVTEEARARGAELFGGMRAHDVESLVDDFARTRMMPRLHPGAAAALDAHRRAGDRLVILSAALQPVVESLGRRLRVTDCYGAPCEMDDGRYTGRLSGPTPHGDGKVTLARSLMDRWGLDPARCFAYADHEHDITLLRAVGHPVAVRPKPGLLKVAEAEGWPVLA